MKIEEIKIEMCYNLGNYSTVKIGQVASVESNDKVNDCYRDLMQSIEENFKKIFQKDENAQCNCRKLKETETPKEVKETETVKETEPVKEPEADKTTLQRRNSLLWKKISVDFRNGKISLADIEKKYFLNKEMTDELQTIQKEKNRVELDCSGSEVIEVKQENNCPFVERKEKTETPKGPESVKEPESSQQFVATNSPKFNNIVKAIQEKRAALSTVYKYFRFDKNGDDIIEQEYKKAFQE